MRNSIKIYWYTPLIYRIVIIGAFGARQKAYSEDYLCDTVDECCFGMTREVFDSLRFNEKVCNGWHLYAVEMCLRAKERAKFGGRYAIPAFGIFQEEMSI